MQLNKNCEFVINYFIMEVSSSLVDLNVTVSIVHAYADLIYDYSLIDNNKVDFFCKLTCDI